MIKCHLLASGVLKCIAKVWIFRLIIKMSGSQVPFGIFEDCIACYFMKKQLRLHYGIFGSNPHGHNLSAFKVLQGANTL